MAFISMFPTQKRTSFNHHRHPIDLASDPVLRHLCAPDSVSYAHAASGRTLDVAISAAKHPRNVLKRFICRQKAIAMARE
jgi:hypothetical protein